MVPAFAGLFFVRNTNFFYDLAVYDNVNVVY